MVHITEQLPVTEQLHITVTEKEKVEVAVPTTMVHAVTETMVQVHPTTILEHQLATVTETAVRISTELSHVVEMKTETVHMVETQVQHAIQTITEHIAAPPAPPAPTVSVITSTITVPCPTPPPACPNPAHPPAITAPPDPPSSSPTSSVPAAATTHTVTVGGPLGLLYSPPSLSASAGDKIIFTFLSQNHTLTQSTFDNPCVAKPGGVASGFIPNPNNTVVPAPTFEYVVEGTEPTWWYCAQGKHCQAGMVFAINPTAEKSFEAFLENAVGGGIGSAPAVPSVSGIASGVSTAVFSGSVPTALATATSAPATPPQNESTDSTDTQPVQPAPPAPSPSSPNPFIDRAPNVPAEAVEEAVVPDSAFQIKEKEKELYGGLKLAEHTDMRQAWTVAITTEPLVKPTP